MANRFYLLSFLLVLTSTAESAKILALFGIPSKSHLISASNLLTELAKRGHEVTLFSYYPLDPQVKHIPLEINEEFQNIISIENELTVWETFDLMKWVTTTYCESILEQPKAQEFISRNDLQFDLIIFESIWSECLYGFVHKFRAPYVQYIPNAVDATMEDSVGNDFGVSYIPTTLLGSSGKMTFKDRFLNTLIQSIMHLASRLYIIPKQEAIMRKYFKDPSLPSIPEMIRNASLLMMNSHFSLHYPRPFTPNSIEVGGMHVKPAKKLPEDLQKFLDEAKDGVVYFSMGSVLRGSSMSEEMRNAFLKAFSKLKQKVLWKWEIDSLPGQPANVKLGKWLPQNDILAHPNVRVFITHGGLLSSQEAIYHGVSLLAIPVFGDQRRNAAAAQNKGYAIMLEMSNITTDSLSWALNEIINNPRYRDNVKRMSTLFRDRPEPPLERAVYWIEYVIRHKGARHLRSAALDLSWYQYYLLDVLAVMIGAAVFVVLALYFSCRTVYRLLTSKKPTTSSRAKKMN